MTCPKGPEWGSGVSVLLALNGVGGHRQVSSAFSSRKSLVFITQEFRWAPGPIWIGAENLAPTVFHSGPSVNEYNMNMQV
jgi:hypothetical protein